MIGQEDSLCLNSFHSRRYFILSIWLENFWVLFKCIHDILTVCVATKKLGYGTNLNNCHKMSVRECNLPFEQCNQPKSFLSSHSFWCHTWTAESVEQSFRSVGEIKTKLMNKSIISVTSQLYPGSNMDCQNVPTPLIYRKW